MKADVLQHIVPNLLGVRAGKQEVVGMLSLLVTEGAGVGLLKTMPLAVLHRPEPAMECDPEEELDLSAGSGQPTAPWLCA